MKYLLAVVMAAIVFSFGCSFRIGSTYPCDPSNVYCCPNHGTSCARYGAVIISTRSLPFTDRAEILTSIAQKPDLTPADRNLIIKESQSLPFTDRSEILRILAESKTNPGSYYPCNPPNVQHDPNHDKDGSRYGSVIIGTRSLPSPADRTEILISIAQKHDLTPADRDLLIKEAQSLPSPTDRANILKILANPTSAPAN